MDNGGFQCKLTHALLDGESWSVGWVSISNIICEWWNGVDSLYIDVLVSLDTNAQATVQAASS